MRTESVLISARTKRVALHGLVMAMVLAASELLAWLLWYCLYRVSDIQTCQQHTLVCSPDGIVHWWLYQPLNAWSLGVSQAIGLVTFGALLFLLRRRSAF